jgi:hypothetical protein
MRFEIPCAPMWFAEGPSRHSRSPVSEPVCGPSSSLESSMSGIATNEPSVIAAHSATTAAYSPSVSTQ